MQDDIAEERGADEAQQTERQLTTLIEASSALLTRHTSAEAVRTIIRLAQQFIRADAYAVWRKRTGSDEWTLVESAGLSENYARSIRGQSGRISAFAKPVPIEDVDRSDLIQFRSEIYRAEGIRAFLTVPLLMGEEVAGTLVFYYRSPHRFSDAEIRVSAALGNLAAAAVASADLHEFQTALRQAAERSEARAAFLAKAGEVLSSSLDYQTTLRAIARLGVPTFADWCSVDIVDDSQTVHRLAVEHIDPDKVRLAYELNRRYPPSEQDASRIVLRTGKAVLASEISEQQLKESTRDEEHLEIIRSLGLKSAILAPMVLRDKVLGLISFVTAESGRRYDAADFELAQELARRAALAIDHARLYEAARESESRFRRAILEAPVPIMIHTSGGEVLYLSRAWTDITGYAAGDISTVSEWARRASAGRAAEMEQFMTAPGNDNLAPAPGKEFGITTSTGQTRSWIFSTATVGSLADDREVRITTALDVTERRQLEQAPLLLAAIVESSEDAIISKDLSGIITSWNRGAARMYGYSAEEALGQSVSMLSVPERVNEMPGILERIRRGERIENYETTRRTKDGREITVSLTVSPILDTTGQIVGASKIARDITEWKRSEEALRQSNEALARTNAALEQFAYAAAHDLQEPLRMIGIYSQLLQRRLAGALDGDVEQFLGFVTTGARRMQTLVADLLAFTEAGEALDNFEPADCNLALQEVERNLSPVISETGAQITSGTLPIVGAHRTHVVQMLQNLISNALKYRKPNVPPRIDVTAQEDGTFWVISVRDNGIGIDPRYHQRIFGVFKRLHTDKYPGTGIGLAICARVIERYGGRIWVESQAGIGATFHFSLPKVST